jgi:hypothetical protein
MDLRLYMHRSENEIKLPEIIFTISKDLSMQIDLFNIKEPETFYSAVISHCYYSIF